MDLQTLHDEIVLDPLGRSYSTMADSEIATDLNTKYRSRNVEQMTGSEVAQNIDISEFNALSDTNKQLLFSMLGWSSLNPWGVEAVFFQGVFPPGGPTLLALAAARVESISRATELGLSFVTSGDVTDAKAWS